MADFSEPQLKKKTVPELNDIIEKNSIEVDEDAKKPDLIDAIIRWQEHKASTGNDDEELDDDDEEEDDDEPAVAVDEEEEDDLVLPDEDEVDEAPAKPAAKSKVAVKQTKYTEGGKTENGEKLLGAKEVATAIGTDAKSLRQFFRSGKSTHFTAVGAGGRYEFKESDIEAIGKEYSEYKAGKPGRGRGASEGGEKKPRASRGKPAVAPEQVIDEVEEIEDLEELEGDDDVEEITADELDDEEED